MASKLYKEELKIKKRDKRRYITITVCAILVFALIFARTFDIQVVNSEKYVEQANGISKITAPIKASRGEILDYYGRPIATNREGYNIVFNYASIKKTTINDTILSLIKLLGDYSWKDDLPLTKEGYYGFDKEASELSKNRMLDMLELAHYATAQNCFDALVKRYSLEDRDKKQQRLIMGVRYTMERAGFSISVPFTFAEVVYCGQRVEFNSCFVEQGCCFEGGVSRGSVPFSVCVVNVCGTVDGQSHKYVVFLEKSAPVAVYKGSVGLESVDDLLSLRVLFLEGECSFKVVYACRGRLSSMPAERDLVGLLR